MVGGGSDLGAARARAARRLLPLAPGRGAGRRRRLPGRGQPAAPAGPRPRDPDRGRAVVGRAGAARPAVPAGAGPAGRRAARPVSRPGRGPRLTPREAEVLALLARGYTNRQIAEALVISVRSAGVRVSHILRKLDAPNRLEAAAIAHRLADA